MIPKISQKYLFIIQAIVFCFVFLSCNVYQLPVNSQTSEIFYKLPFQPSWAAKVSQSCVSTTRVGCDKLYSHTTANLIYAVDFECLQANPFVVAIADGVVIKNVVDLEYGNFLSIQHSGGEVSRYAHMQFQSLLPVGGKVLSGQIIGNCGSTGSSTGNHLHLELLSNATNTQTKPIKFQECVNNLNCQDNEVVLGNVYNSNNILIDPVGEKEPQTFAQIQGRLFQSARGMQNQILTRAANNQANWSNWSDSGSTSKAPAIINFNNRLIQTVRASDDSVNIRSTLDGSLWTGWQSNGFTLSSPSLVVFNNKVYVFVRGTDNQIYYKSSLDGINWNNWINMGGAIFSSPELAVINSTLVISVMGNQSLIFTRTTADGINWSNWQSGNGATLSTPILTPFANKLFQTLRGSDNRIYSRFSSDGQNWSNWQQYGGATISSPSQVSFAGKMIQSVRGTNNFVYTRSSNDGQNWSGWIANGGTISSPAFGIYDNLVYQTVVGVDNATYTRSSSDGQNWSNWVGDSLSVNQ